MAVSKERSPDTRRGVSQSGLSLILAAESLSKLVGACKSCTYEPHTRWDAVLPLYLLIRTSFVDVLILSGLWQHHLPDPFPNPFRTTLLTFLRSFYILYLFSLAA